MGEGSGVERAGVVEQVHRGVDRAGLLLRCREDDERYPRDRAVGFTNGEIRGWFWVELSKPER